MDKNAHTLTCIHISVHVYTHARTHSDVHVHTQKSLHFDFVVNYSAKVFILQVAETPPSEQKKSNEKPKEKVEKPKEKKEKPKSEKSSGSKGMNSDSIFIS